MLLEKPGEFIVIGEKTYTVGAGIVGIKDEYAGLTGYIAEIRDGAEKETENETVDIYCCFDEPTDPDKVKELEEIFSELYEETKTLEDICLDMVIMASDMVEVLD